MKKFIPVLLLCLALVLIACLPAAAGAETKVKLADDVTVKKGRTTISWSVTGTDASMYWVYAQAINGDAEQSRVLIGFTSSHKIKADTLMPGKKYEITVTDTGMKTLAKKKYKIPKAEKFQDSKLRAKSVVVRITPVKQAAGSTKDPSQIKTLKASTIKKAVKDKGDTFGVKYLIKMPQLAKERTFFVMVTVEAPNGYLKTCQARDVTFEKVYRGYQTLWFKNLDPSFFSDMYSATKTIPTGEYKVKMFWDGMLVNTGKFVVK